MWQMADSWEASQVCRSLSSPVESVERKTHLFWKAVPGATFAASK